MRLNLQSSRFLRCSQCLPVISGALWLHPNDVNAEITGVLRKKTDTVILHSIGGPDCIDGKRVFAQIDYSAKYWAQYLATVKDKGTHYVIGRDGDVQSSTPENQIAYHAREFNTHAIGIELVNNGDGKDAFPDVQIESLVKLLQGIRKRYGIDEKHILTHEFADHGRTLECGGLRKVDPGSNFPIKDVIARSTPVE
jgi:N-acetyl-anhydromuramyl-L-alanine amidase AmpD